MNRDSMLVLVTLLGWLLFAGSALHARQVGLRKAIVMALTWAAIFVLVAGVFTLFAPRMHSAPMTGQRPLPHPPMVHPHLT